MGTLPLKRLLASLLHHHHTGPKEQGVICGEEREPYAKTELTEALPVDISTPRTMSQYISLS